MDKERLIEIFNTEEFASTFLVALISADTNNTKEEIEEHLKILYECQDILPQIENPKMREMIVGGVQILERDLKQYEDKK